MRAFNNVWDQVLAKRAHCDGPRIVIPLAADDAEAMDVAVHLVRDAGFDPVEVGDLSLALEFDHWTRVYASNMTGGEVRGVLNKKSSKVACLMRSKDEFKQIHSS